MKDELLNVLLFGAKNESLNNVLQDLKEAVCLLALFVVVVVVVGFHFVDFL